MKITKKLFVAAMIIFAIFAFAGCGSTDDIDDAAETETTTVATEAATEPAPTINAQKYGYDGDDPVEAAVYEYLVEEIAENNYGVDDDNTISVPVVKVIDRVDNQDGSADVAGEFQIYNYRVEGDTLKCISGGSHPGKMHVVKDPDTDGDDDDDGANDYDNEYEVASFDQVGDGSNFDPTAKKIFGDKYDAFVKATSDDKDLDKLRGEALAVYVKATGLAVTKYQDEGWDPVELPL